MNVYGHVLNAAKKKNKQTKNYMNIYEKKFATIYDLLFGEQTQDLEFYKYFIEKQNGPALEVGSGTGRLLIPYLQSGLQVEGVEPNKDMSDICLTKANSINVKPVIYQQFLEELKLTKKYNTIYMPLYAFQHITKRSAAIKALKNSYDHLETNGQILISIFIPWNDPTGTYEQIWRIRNLYDSDGQQILLSESVSYDKFEQVQTKQLKYEIFKDNKLVESYLNTIEFRCYSIYELTIMLEQAGFKDIEIFGDYTHAEANASTDTFIFSGIKK